MDLGGTEGRTRTTVARPRAPVRSFGAPLAAGPDPPRIGG